MQTATKVLSLLIAVVLLGLAVTGAVSLHKTLTLSLPIPKATPISALLLPLITGLSLRASQYLARRSQGPFLSTNTGLLLIPFLLIIYETVIATLSITYMAPINDLNCPLDQRWQQLFGKKDATAIKRIQDAHQCCGLHSTLDRAWPFQAQNRPASTCREMMGRDRSCLGTWRRDMQVAGGMVLFVAVMSFGVTIIVILYAQNRATASERHSGTNGKDTRHAVGRLLGIDREHYRDDPSSGEDEAANSRLRKAITGNSGQEANHEAHQNGPVLQASRDPEGGTSEQNAWA